MLNMDFSRPVCIDTLDRDWVPSPAPGVLRKPLAREAAERGHATSIVRYQPGASFAPHDHPLGEEILVLEGTFSDETGDFPAGTYFRNPPGFRHAPFSEQGCVILVKLHQFQPRDSARVAVDSRSANWRAVRGGLQLLPLHRYGDERVALVRWRSGLRFEPRAYPGGLELYLLAGGFSDQLGDHGPGTWLRYPRGSEHRPRSAGGGLAWVKRGHLPAGDRGASTPS